MGEGMPLGAECALRARRLAASDPYQPADPRQGRQVYRAGGGGDKKEARDPCASGRLGTRRALAPRPELAHSWGLLSRGPQLPLE